MQVLPVVDISDRRHLVPKHPLVVKHLVLSNLSDPPTKTGLLAIDLKWQLGVSYPTSLADSAEADAGKSRTGDAKFALRGNVQAR